MNALAVGWDLHRKFSRVSLQRRDARGEIRVVRRSRLRHADRAGLEAWLRKLPPGTPIGIEATFGWPWLADLLRERGFEPRLGHPPAIRVLTRHEPKTDRLDADRLGRLLLRGVFPECYLAPPSLRQLRERLRHRLALVGLRTECKNRVHAVLHRQGILHNFSDLFGRRGMQFLSGLSLPATSRAAIDDHLQLLRSLREQIERIDTWLKENLAADAIVGRLTTIPGIGPILAHTIRAEIGDVARFARAKRLASYAGLAPLANDSADRSGRRHVARACNHVLRWAFVEAAACALRSRACPAKWRGLYNRLTCGGRVRKLEAQVAVAHKVCELVYAIWKTGQPYRGMKSGIGSFCDAHSVG